MAKSAKDKVGLKTVIELGIRKSEFVFRNHLVVYVKSVAFSGPRTSLHFGKRLVVVIEYFQGWQQKGKEPVGAYCQPAVVLDLSRNQSTMPQGALLDCPLYEYDGEDLIPVSRDLDDNPIEVVVPDNFRELMDKYYRGSGLVEAEPEPTVTSPALYNEPYPEPEEEEEEEIEEVEEVATNEVEAEDEGEVEDFGFEEVDSEKGKKKKREKTRTRTRRKMRKTPLT